MADIIIDNYPTVDDGDVLIGRIGDIDEDLVNRTELAAANALVSETNAAASEASTLSATTNAISVTTINVATTNANAATTNANALSVTADKLIVEGYKNAAEAVVDGVTLSEANALTYSNNAATSESNALTSETNASTSETNAATSASNALTSETNASASETQTGLDATATAADRVQTGLDVASTSADVISTNADVVLTNADVVTTTSNADTSTTQAGIATTKAGEASSDAAQVALDLIQTNQDTIDTAADVVTTNADVVLTNADAAQTNLDRIATSADRVQTGLDATATSNDRVAIETIYDNFDDRYLGQFASDPTLDNDGQALLVGAMYFNTTVDNTKFYNGASWEDPELTATQAASTATTQAGIATTKATEASASASTASTAATTSTTNLGLFEGQYSSSATAPATPTEGALWFDETANIMKVYDGSIWMNAGSSVNGTSARFEFTATAGQTTFLTTGFDSGFADVYQNGIKLINTVDFNDTDGTNIVLTVGANLDDEISVIAYGTFLLADHYSKTVSDARYLQLTGGTVTGPITAPDFIGPLDGAVQFTAKNTSGGTITKGQAIAISGISGNTPTVTLADADATTMPAFGLAATTATDNLELEIVTFGSLKGIKTDYTGWALGDTLYISTTAGTLTNVPPAGEAAKIQNMGIVERLHSSNGTIKVGGAGRSNATPNLDEGNVFIGNASNQSVPRALVIADTTGLQTALDLKANQATTYTKTEVNQSIGNINSPLLDLPLTNNLSMKQGTGAVTFSRATTATYIDRYGVLKYAGIDEPRFEADGLLIEGTSTNLKLYSNSLSSGIPWAGAGVTFVENNAIAPDGTSNTAHTVTFTGTNQSLETYTTGTSSGVYKTYSHFVKGVAGETITLILDIFGAVSDTFTLDGTWQRLSIGKAGADTTVYTKISTVGATARVVEVFGAQLESLPFASSYIPTTTSAVTRSADVCSVDKANVPLLSKDFSLTMDISLSNSMSLSTRRTFFRTDDLFSAIHTVDDVLVSYYDNTLITYTGSFDFIGTKSYGYTLSSTTYSQYKDGSLIDSDTVTLAGNNDIIYLGHQTDANYRLFGHIKNFKIYDKSLSATEIALLQGTNS